MLGTLPQGGLMRTALALLLLWASSCLAKDFGVQGHLYPVLEPSLLEEITGKLKALEKTGDLTKHQETLKAKAKASLARPKPVPGMTKTKTPQSWLHDPSIRLTRDLMDQEGRIFYKKGSVLNPLVHASCSRPLLFIDGDDQTQVMWAAFYRQPNKIILVKGSPFVLMESLERPVFFDQGGKLTKTLRLAHVPALVVQEGLRLRISQLVLEEGR